MVNWDCDSCWREFDVTVETARRRFEETTVYKPRDEFEAFVCPQCGGLLKPYPRSV